MCKGDCGRQVPARDLEDGRCEDCQAGPMVITNDGEEDRIHIDAAWICYPTRAQYKEMEAGCQPKHLIGMEKELLKPLLERAQPYLKPMLKRANPFDGYFGVFVDNAPEPHALFKTKDQAETWGHGAFKRARVEVHMLKEEATPVAEKKKAQRPQEFVDFLAMHTKKGEPLDELVQSLLWGCWKVAFLEGRKSVIGEMDPEDKG